MAADGEQPPPPPRQLTELESLQLKCNEKTDESLESTRRMKGMCEEAKDMGIKTLVLLDDQGEQLEKFEGAAEGINADMKLAEHALNSMDLLCGIFPKFWKKSGGFKEDDAVWGEGALRQVRMPEKKLVQLFILNQKKTYLKGYGSLISRPSIWWASNYLFTSGVHSTYQSRC